MAMDSKALKNLKRPMSKWARSIDVDLLNIAKRSLASAGARTVGSKASPVLRTLANKAIKQSPAFIDPEKLSKRLGAMMAIDVGGGVAAMPVMQRLGEDAFKKPYSGWQEMEGELAKDIGVEDVPIFTSKRLKSNAFYSPRGLDERMAEILGIKTWDKLTKDPKAKHGVIIMGEDAPGAVLGHEMGHAVRNKRRGEWGKKWALPLQHLSSALSVLAAVGGAALGRKVPGALGKMKALNPLRPGPAMGIGHMLRGKVAPYVGAALGGLGAGYAAVKPKLSEESGSSDIAHKALKKLRGEAEAADARKRLTKAYRTYQIGAALPVLTGTIPMTIWK